MTLETTSTRYENFGEGLRLWWRKNRRQFPWRKVVNPYGVLVSEILLHRTRADQVVPVYKRFIERYPTLDHLSKAKQTDVTRILRPLGLAWRNRLLKPLAREIVSSHHGRIPSTVSELESLPGVSKYTAAAVACFAYGKAEPILDTNTVRILGRVFGLTVSDSARRSRRFSEVYRSLIWRDNPQDFNYAMLDLGALICLPKNPECEICPLSERCFYAMTKRVE
jgi:A/G-specific adenine glycosylase